jgi:SAM-dependent methyltransferase
MFNQFVQVVMPTAAFRVLDVGVTGDQHLAESNFFESSYPFPDRLIGLGNEDLGAARRSHAAVRFVRGDGCRLPFRSAAFDIVFSHATIEHAGSRTQQMAFVRELLRVSGRCFLTTPNRWFPFELHTFFPLLHYLPRPVHRWVLRRLGREFYSREDNLNLLSRRDLRALFPREARVRVWFSFLGTNLIAYAETAGPDRDMR